MLKKLVIENFQSHEKTELNLHPNVNVITGVSQSGKTAILRALYWLLHNRPSGERMRSHFAKGATKVMIQTAEDDTIWHVKDDKTNAYTMGDNIFDKIGKDIPDMVQRALRISELNVQKQLDEPFLITSSAGEVAKTINRITRLEMVDEWVTDLTQSINALNREKDQLESDIESHRNKIKSYRVLVDLQPLLDATKSNEKVLTKLIEKCINIKGLYNKVKFIKEDRVLLFEQFGHLKGILDGCNELQDRVEKLTEKAKVARLALRAYQTAQRLKATSEPLKKALELQERINSLSLKHTMIITAKSDFDWFKKTERIMENNKIHLHNAIIKMKVCPTCLQPITQTAVKKIMWEV